MHDVQLARHCITSEVNAIMEDGGCMENGESSSTDQRNVDIRVNYNERFDSSYSLTKLYQIYIKNLH